MGQYISKLIFVSIVLLVTKQIYAAENTEEITRGLIIARLLNQIDPAEVKPEKPIYELCIYREPQLYKVFQGRFAKITITQKPVKTHLVRSRQLLNYCDAIFMGEPSPGDLNWLIGENSKNQALLIVDGRKAVVQGIHIGLYLNPKGYFDFDINPDAFIATNHNLTAGLLELGNIVDNQVEKKSQLMRNLINFTEWPKNTIVENEFQICTYPNSVMTTFLQHYLTKKLIKGKKPNYKTVTHKNELMGCHVLLISNQKLQSMDDPMISRMVGTPLLIGDTSGLGEHGVHYNLAPSQNSHAKRFEINLLAFEKTGHKPDYQLLNSAVVIKNDFPELSRYLVESILLTQWPKESKLGLLSKSNNQQTKTLKLCVYQNKYLRSFLSKHLKKYERDFSYKIELAEVKNSIETNLKEPLACDVFFTHELSQPELAYLIRQINNPATLLITSQPSSNELGAQHLPIHYNLLTQPRSILREVFIENLKGAGFVPQKELLKSSAIVRGGFNE
jgi:hypothetical protein